MARARAKPQRKPRRRNVRRNFNVPESQCAAFKGTIPAGKSSALTLSGMGIAGSSIKIQRVSIQVCGASSDFDRVAPCLLQADYYTGKKSNAWLHNQLLLVTHPTMITFSWPPNTDYSVDELNQELIQLDNVCMASGHAPNILYVGRLWFLKPPDSVPINCVTQSPSSPPHDFVMT